MALVINGEKSYEGRVLNVYSRDERVMSDIYALVSRASVAEADGSVKDLYLKAHFECDTREVDYEVDASPAVLALVNAKLLLDSAKSRVGSAEKKVAEVAARVPVAKAVSPGLSRGDLVMVAGKVEGLVKGDFHEVAWVGNSHFNDSLRVLLVVNGKKVYCSDAKVLRVSSEDELKAAEAKAAEVLANRLARNASSLRDAEDDLASAKLAVPAAEAVYLAALEASEVAAMCAAEAAAA